MVDLGYLEYKTKGLSALKDSFTRFNTDASSIFLSTTNMSKSELVNATLQLLCGGDIPLHGLQPPKQFGIGVAEGFVVQPLISLSSWPLPRDPFFRRDDTIGFLYTTNRLVAGLCHDNIPTVGLGQMKSLIYVTKQGPHWLLKTILAALKAYQIEHTELGLGHMILCRIVQVRNHISFYEAYGIKIRKMPLRPIFGFRVSKSLFKARETGRKPQDFDRETERQTEIRKTLAECVKGYLEAVERNPHGPPPEPPPYPMGVVEVHGANLTELPHRPSPLAYPERVAELSSTGISELPGSGR